MSQFAWNRSLCEGEEKSGKKGDALLTTCVLKMKIYMALWTLSSQSMFCRPAELTLLEAR